MRILLTGSSGFVGGAVKNYLISDSHDVIAPTRVAVDMQNRENSETVSHFVGDINGETDWRGFLENIDTIVHCAGVADSDLVKYKSPVSWMRSVNTEGTLNLARQAINSRVKRFVFLSSIKVNGELTRPGNAFKADDSSSPKDAYGMSKCEAEAGLLQISSGSQMEVTIIRPPIVYGAGVKGNFAKLIRLVEFEIPLPFSSIDNRRSFVGLDNLSSLVSLCVSHPLAGNEVFLASDGQDLSTPELLRGIAKAMEKASRLFPCPPKLLSVAATCFGKADLAEKLVGSLQIDISKAKHILGWVPPVSVEEGLARCFPKT